MPPKAVAQEATRPWYSKERLLAARTPIGFVMHYGAMYMLTEWPLLLQLPSIAVIWWELGKEFPKYGHLVQYGMTLLSYLDILLLRNPETPIWTVALVRLVVVALLCALGGAKRIDTIIINYVLVGLTAVLVLMARYPIAVMLTISMSIAGSDCAQFFSGKVAGRTKIVPKISPNKSLEGYVFALISCTCIYYFYLADEQLMPIHLGLLYVVVMLLVGIFGDLFLSWWKRNHQLKDTSAVLGAHGGFLDRLDSHMAAWLWSVLFAAIFSQPGNNFTGMDFDKIMWRLIPITWTILWSHWFGKRIFGLGG